MRIREGDVGEAEETCGGRQRRTRGWFRRRRAEDEDETVVIDLDALTPVPGLDGDGTSEAGLALFGRRDAEAERAAAAAELEELRRRHWSADRVLEEGRLGIDWWDHPLADPHAVLDVLPGASAEELAAARRRAARQVHPDVHPEDPVEDGHRRMAAVNASYDRIRRASDRS